MLGLIPVAVGGSRPLGPFGPVPAPKEYAGAGLLLALGIWRRPLLTLAYLYQTTLIAVNREAAGVRLLLSGAVGLGAVGRPLLLLFRPAGGRGGRPDHRPGAWCSPATCSWPGKSDSPPGTITWGGRSPPRWSWSPSASSWHAWHVLAGSRGRSV